MTIPRPSATQYVRVNSGHFFVGTQRVKMWGYNLVNQAGANCYVKATNICNRLRDMGVNGVRYWPGTFNNCFYNTSSPVNFYATSPGDQSGTDAYDWYVHELKRCGIFAENTCLEGRSAIPSYPNSEVQTIVTSGFHGVGKYLSAAYQDMMRQHIQNWLNHLNPYTGTRYHSETIWHGHELANEDHFVEWCMTKTKINTFPTILRTRLVERWEDWQDANSGTTTSALPPYDANWGTAVVAKHIEYRRFLSERFIAVQTAQEAIARATGPGAAVQPFCFGTGGPAFANEHYAWTAGDYCSIGVYQQRLIQGQTSEPFYPTNPWLHTPGPRMFRFNFATAKDKPVICYETNFFRPYTQRVEWGPIMLGMAASQDWDAMYLFQHGTHSINNNATWTNAGYGTLKLPNPPSIPEYQLGVQDGGDETAVASWNLAALAHTNGNISPSTVQKNWRLGGDRIYNHTSLGYGTGGTGSMTDATIGNGKLGVEFAPALPSIVGPGTTPGGAVGPHITWDFPNTRIKFDSPDCKIIAGNLPATTFTFSGGVTIQVNSPIYTAIGAVRDDQGWRFYAIGIGTNTGYFLNNASITWTHPAGLISGTTVSPGNRGTAPVVFQRPSCTITLPGVTGTFRKWNFQLVNYSSPVVSNGQFTISSGEAFFFGQVSTSGDPPPPPPPPPPPVPSQVITVSGDGKIGVTSAGTQSSIGTGATLTWSS